jgi:hypothetical protein
MRAMKAMLLRVLLAAAIVPCLTGCAVLFPQAPTEIRNTRMQVDSSPIYYGGPLYPR